MMLGKQTRGWLQSPIGLLSLISVLLMLFALAYQGQKRIDIDVAARSNEKFLDHFYPVESGARLTEARSGVWLPDLGGGNLAWRIGLSLIGPPLGESDAPAERKASPIERLVAM